MRPTVVRLLGGVGELHPFKHLCATNSSARHPTLIIHGKAALEQFVVDLEI
jgi:hypothetical protein